MDGSCVTFSLTRPWQIILDHNSGVEAQEELQQQQNKWIGQKSTMNLIKSQDHQVLKSTSNMRT